MWRLKPPSLAWIVVPPGEGKDGTQNIHPGNSNGAGQRGGGEQDEEKVGEVFFLKMEREGKTPLAQRQA